MEVCYGERLTYNTCVYGILTFLNYIEIFHFGLCFFQAKSDLQHVFLCEFYLQIFKGIFDVLNIG